MRVPVSLRRFAFPLRLVGRAARARAASASLLVALGVVAGAAVLAAVLGGRLVMQDRSLAQATAQLAARRPRGPGDVERRRRQLPAARTRGRRPQLRRVTGTAPAAAMLFRESSIQGRLVNLRAADDLGRYVRLVSGRLPATCVPAHCEVLRLKGAGPIPSTPALHLIVVGRAVLKPDAPIAPFVLPAPPTEMVAQAVRYHTPQPSPIVIANGIAGLSRTTELETFYRSYALVRARSASGDVHPWSVGAFSARVQRISAQLEASPDEFEVTAPTDTLATAAASSTAAARRLLLLGGEGGALLLAFTVLAAAALRRDVGDARRRLVWFGATRWQVELFTLAESAALAVAGTIVGWALGGAVAALVAARAGSPAGQVVTHAPALARRAARRARRSPRSPGCCSTRPCARRACSSAGSRSRRSTPPRSARSRSCSSAGRAARSTRRQLASSSGTSAFLLLVPGADRLRRGGARRAPARARAARARTRRPARADLAAARRRLARAKPGPRRDRRDVPRREPRARAVRASPTARRSSAASTTRRRTRCRRRSCSPRISRSSSRCCTARRSRVPGDAATRAAALRQRPERRDVHVPRAADAALRGRRRLAQRLRVAAAHGELGRRLDAARRHGRCARRPCPPGRRFTLPGLGRRRRRRRARDLPLAARRLRARCRSATRTAASRVVLRGRIPFRARDARAARSSTC